MSRITLDTVFVRNQDMLTSQIDDEVVMMDMDVGNYYGLNPVGTRIWDLFEAPQCVRTICEQLLKEYDVSEAVCRDEVLDFIASMSAQQLLKQVEESVV